MTRLRVGIGALIAMLVAVGAIAVVSGLSDAEAPRAGGLQRLFKPIGEPPARARYRVPSRSMLPTLKEGQIVVSNNRILTTRPPALNDIIVFHPPAGAVALNVKCGAPHEGGGTPRPCGRPTRSASGLLFIQRIVGLPGDRIAVVEGRVIRNGKPEPQPYRTERCNGTPGCTFAQPITVPAGEYFVLGDNRPRAEDSRYWGPVKRSWIVGLVSR